MNDAYLEALDIVKTEAQMMANGDRMPSISIRWLKEAIELLEGADKQ